MDRHRPLVILAVLGMLLGCGKDQAADDRHERTPPPPTPPPAPPDPSLKPFGFDGLAAWAPAKLIDLPRERITPLPDVDIVDARYVVPGMLDVHVNFSLPRDGAAARAFYESARPPYIAAKSGKFPIWVREYRADDGRMFAEACTLLQDRLGLCVSALPGWGRHAQRYLEALDLHAMDRWADPTRPGG
jgi:hypothetical protein